MAALNFPASPQLDDLYAANGTTFQWDGVKWKVYVSPAEELATVATSGSYEDLVNKPTIPSLTGYATESYVTTQVANLVDSAPAALDTLNELAAALGDDANFASTVTTSLSEKAPINNPTFTGTVTVGDITLGSEQIVFDRTVGDNWIGSSVVIENGNISIFEPPTNFYNWLNSLQPGDKFTIQPGGQELTVASTSNPYTFIINTEEVIDESPGGGTTFWITSFTQSGQSVISGNIISTSNIETTSDIKGRELYSTYSSGDEGGQVNLAKPQTNSTIQGTGVVIDLYQNKLRIFEQGGTARGAYIDLTTASAGVGSNLLAGGGGGGGGGGASVTISDTAPSSPQAGNLWWNSTDGYMYIYYTDADSSQWVVATPTFAFQTLAENVTGVVAASNGGTGLTSPGASGNVLTSTGTGWESQTAAMVPPGTIITYAGSTAPAGYLVADSAAVSRTTYAALFAVIGTTYGAGDGSTTFNLPNLVDRMPIGSGGLYALGATGGSKDAVVVEHTHEITDPGHKHQLRADSDTAPDGGVGLATDDGINVAIRVDAMDNQVTGITVNSTGSSGTDANLPPYIGQLYCIKF